MSSIEPALNYSSIIRQHLHRLQPSEAFLPFDNPTFENPAWDKASFRVLIARLSPFRDVDRSWPHLFLFQEVRRAAPSAFIDLAFFPHQAARTLFAQHNIPYLLGVQSLCAAQAFDLILISNAYTLELINLPYLLLRSDMPLWAGQRGDEWPLLILGGSNAMATQSIIAADGDCLADALFFGEGEGAVAELVARLAGCERAERREMLSRLAAAPGVRIEGLWRAGSRAGDRATCRAAIRSGPSAADLLIHSPLLNSAETRTASLQIGYGCPAFCSFCFEGYERKPYRELPMSALLQAARQIKQAQGCEELNLYSFNFNTHCDILPLLARLGEMFDRVGLKSQRVDLLQSTELLLEAELLLDKRSFTLGIEGISERQRAWLHKSLSNPDIEALLRRLFEARVKEIKLFYLLGGHENEDDLAEFRRFVGQVQDIRRSAGSGRVIFSFGLLIRMPFTPLRHDRLILDEAAWKPLIGQVKSACETHGFEFRLAFDWSDYAVSQVLALGGYWLHQPVIELARQGFFFDAALPDDYWPKLQSWMKQNGQWTDAFLGEKAADYPFALEFVQGRVSAPFLYRQFEAGRAWLDEGYCLGTERCLSCGACRDEAQRQTILQHRIEQPPRGPYLAGLRRTIEEKRRLKPTYLRLRLSERLSGALPEWVDAYVFQGLLRLHPDWTDRLLSVRESLFTTAANARRFPSLSGETVFALKSWEQITGQAEVGDGFEVLGPAEGFTPGEYTRLTLQVFLPTAHFAEPRKRLEAYLQKEYLGYSLKRQDQRFVFDVHKPGLKKKLVLGGWFEAVTGGWRAYLEVGVRFDVMAWLEGFGSRNLHHQARVTVLEVQW